MDESTVFDRIIYPEYIDMRGACTDMVAKQELLRSVFGDSTYQDLVRLDRRALDPEPGVDSYKQIEDLDERIKEWLAPLPGLIRLVVELRSGLWTGRISPTDADSIGEALGLSCECVEMLYNEGKRLLAQSDALMRLAPSL